VKQLNANHHVLKLTYAFSWLLGHAIMTANHSISLLGFSSLLRNYWAVIIKKFRRRTVELKHFFQF